jgi:hypothetical protein
VKATKSSKFGSVPDNFIMDNVNCLGNETSLLECSHSDGKSCGPGNAAGVVCFDHNGIFNLSHSFLNSGYLFQIFLFDWKMEMLLIKEMCSLATTACARMAGISEMQMWPAKCWGIY